VAHARERVGVVGAAVPRIEGAGRLTLFHCPLALAEVSERRPQCQPQPGLDERLVGEAVLDERQGGLNDPTQRDIGAQAPRLPPPPAPPAGRRRASDCPRSPEPPWSPPPWLEPTLSPPFPPPTPRRRPVSPASRRRPATWRPPSPRAAPRPWPPRSARRPGAA